MKPPNFLVINPFGIGDCLFTTPVVRAIKSAHPQSFVGYWCNERVAELFRDNPDINRVFALSRGDLKKISRDSKLQGARVFLDLLWQIKNGKFDIAFDFSLDHRYSLFTKFLGIKRRIGFNFRNRGRFLTDRIDTEGFEHRHIVEHYLSLLKFVNIVAGERKLSLFISDDAARQAAKLLADLGINESEPVVAMAPGAGASWGKDAKFKHWPAQRFAQVADRIIREYNIKVVILGDASERPIAQDIAAAAAHKLINLTGLTGIMQLAAVIKRSRLLITNDGGPLHIGVAAGTRTVSIFGPVDEKVYGPYPPSEEHIVIKSGVECRPCYRKFKISVCSIDRECLNSITSDKVFDAVRRLL